ncbi:MAG: class I SAM-dependent methyltransferase [Dehalococcoidia bacterium]
MNQETLKQEWVNLAPAWIKEAREGVNANRTGLLDGPMLKSCGNVSGLRVLECGCGEGRFCRLLVERGAANVLGLDLCLPMIEAASEMQSGSDEYRVADVQDLSFLSDGTFDLAVSYLNQCDLADFDANNREVFRVLKPGGRFIVANLHPMRSAVGDWHRSANGKKLHIVLDHYFEEGERNWRILGGNVTNFHRSLSTYVLSFMNAGFSIVDIVEPTVTAGQLKDYPELADELRVPNFIIYVLKKPTTG